MCLLIHFSSLFLRVLLVEAGCSEWQMSLSSMDKVLFCFLFFFYSHLFLTALKREVWSRFFFFSNLRCNSSLTSLVTKPVEEVTTLLFCFFHTAKNMATHWFLRPCFRLVQCNELSSKTKTWGLFPSLESCLWSILEVVSCVHMKKRRWLTAAKREDTKDNNSSVSFARGDWSCALCKLRRQTFCPDENQWKRLFCCWSARFL